MTQDDPAQTEAARALFNAGRALASPETDPLVHRHASWALGQIGGLPARRHLEAAFAAETDPEVRAEIAAALAAESIASDPAPLPGHRR